MRWVTLGRERLFLYFFVLPGLLYVIVSRIVPALYTIYLSFTKYNLMYDSLPRWNGLVNYIRIVHSAEFLASLRLSIEFASLATGAELLIALGFATFLNNDPPGRNLLLGIFLIPMIMAPVVVATIWSVLFNNLVGLIPYFLQLLHGPNVPWFSTPHTAFFGLLIADVWEWVPLIGLLLFSALQAIPKERLEAATVDGASGVRLFWYITLPQILGMMMVAVGLRFMDAFLELDKVFIMTGGGPGTSTEFVSMHVYKEAFQFFDLGTASAIIVVLLLMLSFVYGFYLRRIQHFLGSYE